MLKNQVYTFHKNLICLFHFSLNQYLICFLYLLIEILLFLRIFKTKDSIASKVVFFLQPIPRVTILGIKFSVFAKGLLSCIDIHIPSSLLWFLQFPLVA